MFSRRRILICPVSSPSVDELEEGMLLGRKAWRRRAAAGGSTDRELRGEVERPAWFESYEDEVRDKAGKIGVSHRVDCLYHRGQRIGRNSR